MLVFGLGMIGSSIREKLLELEYRQLSAIDFDWQTSAKWGESLGQVAADCSAHTPPVTRLSVLWSAGKNGFHCTDDEAASENECFRAVVDFIAKLKASLDGVTFDFHYISSAGGLFEGQRVIKRSSIPTPMRPYGRLKLAQEKLLQECFGRYEVAIYRPSSVYGPMEQKAQQGLINNLVKNARSGRETALDSHVMSLRDYVYTGDIGGFVAKRIKAGLTATGDGPVKFLVSARCSSIFEVVRKIEQTLHLKIRFRYDESFGNHRNITFSDSVLPQGWSPATLNVGIRQFLVVNRAREN